MIAVTVPLATTHDSRSGCFGFRFSPKTGLLCLMIMLSVHAPMALGQTPDFTPLRLHGPRSAELMSRIDKHLTSQTDNNPARDPWIDHVRGRQAALLKRMVRAKAFVDNDTVQAYVESHFHRLSRDNDLASKSRLVLIMNSPETNAACYGSGVFIVTTGLLANMPDEASLAFILAHELAHDELLHVQQSLRVLSRERESRNPGSTFDRILLTDVGEDVINNFRTAMYASAAMSRGHEMQADSAALAYIQRSGYSASAAERALTTLASLRQPDSDDLFASFQFNDFPFKDHWLDERLKIYHRKPVNTFLWSSDSLRSHPRMERRMQMLTALQSDSGGLPCDQVATRPDSNVFHQQLSTVMMFQSIEAAYQTNQYDVALYNLLHQLKTHPGHPYLVARITRILIDMFHAKNEGDVSMLSQFTSHLSSGERLVNTLLFNLSKEEVAELAYHFINNRENFDGSDRAHYYQLWETCELTSRDQIKAKVAAAYVNRFGDDIRNFRID